jgi:hypothetical protein
MFSPGNHFSTISMLKGVFQINGTARFFAFSLIIEGTTEKALKFFMLIMSIFNQNLGFNKKKCFWTLQRGPNNKKLIN